MKLPKIYKNNDADISLIKKKRVGIIGFGNQGKAQAFNLKDSGIDVIIGLRANSLTKPAAIDAGFICMDIEEMVRSCNFISILIPDQEIEMVFLNSVIPYLEKNDTILFSHGYNVFYKLVKYPEYVNIILSAPSAPGTELRKSYLQRGGVPGLVAVDADYSGNSFQLVLSYSKAIGLTRSGVFKTSFKEETETDLFGEQVVLVGGIPKLIESAYNILTEFGYSPVTSWLVCYYELRTIVDMFHAKGFEYMGKAISDTAEYGGLTRGERLINDGVRDEMRGILTEIQNQTFFNEWNLESRNKLPLLNKLRNKESSSKIEEVGKQLLLELFKE